MAHFIPTHCCETMEAPQVVYLPFRWHGLPMSTILDQDVHVSGHFGRHVFAKLNFTLNMSSRDHPQIDGHMKRVNQGFMNILCAYVSNRQID